MDFYLLGCLQHQLPCPPLRPPWTLHLFLVRNRPINTWCGADAAAVRQAYFRLLRSSRGTRDFLRGCTWVMSAGVKQGEQALWGGGGQVIFTTES